MIQEKPEATVINPMATQLLPAGFVEAMTGRD